MSLQINSRGFKFRWINGQCLEIRLPNGKYVLTDPFFPSPTTPMPSQEIMKSSALDFPFGVDDLEGADYIIINHSHGDHTFKIEEIAKKFHSTVIIYSALATDLIRCHDIPLTDVYPVDFNSIYYFDGFSLETFHGTHHPCPAYKENMEHVAATYGNEDKTDLEWNVLGGLYNMNFILNTPEGLSLGFFGGNIDGDYEVFARHRPTILFRNKLHSSKTQYDVASDWAAYLDQCKIPIMVPMHHEKWFVTKPGYVEQLVSDMNRILEEKGSISRVLNPQRAKWYSLDISINSLS